MKSSHYVVMSLLHLAGLALLFLGDGVGSAVALGGWVFLGAGALIPARVCQADRSDVPKAAIRTGTIGIIGACVICIIGALVPTGLARFCLPVGLIWYGVVALIGHRRIFGSGGSNLALQSDRRSAGG